MTASDNTYDLIIVGAGPAGSSAAIFARRAGLRPLLLDKETFPRDKICGDALSGKSVAVLRELDLLEKICKLPGALIQSIIFSSPDHTSFKIDLRTTKLKNNLKGFVIRRQILDEFMFREAQAAGAETIENFVVTDLIFDRDKVTGIIGKRRDSHQEEKFYAPVVFGADGYNSTVARKLKLYRHDPKHWVVALRCYYENVADLGNQIELHYVDEVIPGYFWIFPLENGFANVGIGMLHAYIKSRNIDLRRALRDTIKNPYFSDRFTDARPLEKPVGWNLPVGSIRRRSYGDGFMLLGDAAGLIDPFTGEGIGNAMYSAKYAIQTILDAHEKNDYSAQSLSRYEDNLWRAIGNELSVSTKLQKIGRYRPLLNFVINKAASNSEVSNIIAGMLANEVPRKRLANPLFYVRLFFS